MNEVKLEVPKKSEFISCIRLTSAAFANIFKYDYEKIEDIKVVISEVCTYFINNIKSCSEPFLIEYKFLNNEIKVKITDKNKDDIDDCNRYNKIDCNREQNQMFRLIIDSLTDNYRMDYDSNTITFIINLKNS